MVIFAGRTDLATVVAMDLVPVGMTVGIKSKTITIVTVSGMDRFPVDRLFECMGGTVNRRFVAMLADQHHACR
jgi:hypothetical protein